ncbi:MAG TPA: TcpQ domain-containing protein [Burkholderiaceae bacterium]
MRADSPPSLRTRAVFLRAFCAALLMAVAGNASSLTGKRFVGRYDFGYAIRGDRLARPAQVFDDGSGKVYFEARPNQPMPAVFAGRNPALLVLQPEGQYFSARTSATEFTLVLGAARATVRRGSAVLGDETITPQDDTARLASADGGLPAGVDYDPPADPALRRVRHEQPIVFAPGVATLRPEVLEALSVLVLRIGPDTAITAFGRNDAGGHDALATSRAEALRNALLARGVAARDIHIAAAEDDDATRPHLHASSLRWTSTEQTRDTASSPAALAPSFDITPADRDIAVSLRRWARASGYEIAWDVDWAAPINGALRVEAPSFVDAVQQVVTGLRAQGYPVQARIDADRVVRFVAPE